MEMNPKEGARDNKKNKAMRNSHKEKKEKKNQH